MSDKFETAGPVHSFARGLLALAFPPKCVTCSGWGTAPLCEDCAKLVMQERLAACCPVCAGDVGPYEVTA